MAESHSTRFNNHPAMAAFRRRSPGAETREQTEPPHTHEEDAGWLWPRHRAHNLRSAEPADRNEPRTPPSDEEQRPIPCRAPRTAWSNMQALRKRKWRSSEAEKSNYSLRERVRKMRRCPVHIAIEGNIGSGKTTQLQRLSKLGFETVPEPIEKWPLELFGENPQKYALPLQLSVLIHGAKFRQNNARDMNRTPMGKSPTKT